ncbi:MAG: EscU/YscU/HrcU family type III secretion system export apparatus switch protein [Phycisphaerales bacterium]|nr:EscU/YscU/HrcU family type III secretion system export apparatus switch protein [Phycisphaerales bacterium]
MSESSGSKTLPPSPKRLRDARKKGQVAYSSDLAGAVPLAASVLAIVLMAPRLSQAAVDAARLCFAAAADSEPDIARTILAASDAFVRLASASGAIILTIVVSAFTSSFLQVGPLLTPEPLSPKFESINPVKGLKRLFFSKRAAVELLKNLLKFTITGLVAGSMIWGARGPLANLPLLEPAAAASWIFHFASDLAWAIIGVFIILSIADVLYQRWQHHKDLMMSYEEAKREYKQEEGDPEHKARRKMMHEEVLFGMMLKEVGSADVVITNPQHVACALRWDGGVGTAPRLVAKGVGHYAQRIKDAAARANVPVRRQESLARALVRLEINTEIPPDLYEAVAVILEWAQEELQNAGRTPGWVKQPDTDA